MCGPVDGNRVVGTECAELFLRPAVRAAGARPDAAVHDVGPLVLEGHIQIAFSRILRRLQQRMLDQHAEAVYAVVAYGDGVLALRKALAVQYRHDRRILGDDDCLDLGYKLERILYRAAFQPVGFLERVAVAVDEPLRLGFVDLREPVAVILRPVVGEHIIQREIVELALRFQHRFTALVQKTDGDREGELVLFAGQAAVIVVVSLVNCGVREKNHIRPAHL